MSSARVASPASSPRSKAESRHAYVEQHQRRQRALERVRDNAKVRSHKFLSAQYLFIILIGIGIIYAEREARRSRREMQPGSATGGSTHSDRPDSSSPTTFVAPQDADTIADVLRRNAASIKQVQWPISKKEVYTPDGIEKGREFMQQLQHSAEPVMLLNSPVDLWPWLREWTPPYLSRNTETLGEVTVLHGNDLLYADRDMIDHGQSLKRVRSWGFPEPKSSVQRTQRMDTSTFFRCCQPSAARQANTCKHSMVNADITHAPFLTKELRGGRDGSDNQDVRALLQPFRTRSSDKFELLLWAGCENVTSMTHYDAVSNVYVQHHGTKEFLVFPPDALQVLPTYPRSHPNHRQVQTNLSDLAHGCKVDTTENCSPFHPLRLFPQTSTIPMGHAMIPPVWKSLEHFVKLARPQQVLLQPGDVLFLPAMWFHYVAARSTSVSTAIWTTTEADDKAAEAEQLALPLEADWTPDQLLTAAVSYASAFSHDISKARPNTETDAKSVPHHSHEVLYELLHLRYGTFHSKMTRQSQQPCGTLHLSCFASSGPQPDAQLQDVIPWQRVFHTASKAASILNSINELHTSNSHDSAAAAAAIRMYALDYLDLFAHVVVSTLQHNDIQNVDNYTQCTVPVFLQLVLDTCKFR
jgi:Cupin-like domain